MVQTVRYRNRPRARAPARSTPADTLGDPCIRSVALNPLPWALNLLRCSMEDAHLIPDRLVRVLSHQDHQNDLLHHCPGGAPGMQRCTMQLTLHAADNDTLAGTEKSLKRTPISSEARSSRPGWASGSLGIASRARCANGLWYQDVPNRALLYTVARSRWISMPPQDSQLRRLVRKARHAPSRIGRAPVNLGRFARALVVDPIELCGMSPMPSRINCSTSR